MIVYYDPCYTHRSSRSKEGLRQKCWYLSGGTCCSHSEWTTSANVPIPAHSLVSYIGPEQSRKLPMMHALNWRNVKKSTWEYWMVVPPVTYTFITLTVYIYIQMFRLQYEGPYDTIEHVLKPPLCSRTMSVFMGIRALEYVPPLKMHYYSILPKKKPDHVGDIYGDNFLQHSQSFRIMVKGWTWDPRIWHDLLYNGPSTHKMSCKYLHTDQSYDASLDNTICDAWKICKDFQFSVVAILKILNGGYHKDQVMCPHYLYDVLHTWSPIHKFSCKYSM